MILQGFYSYGAKVLGLKLFLAKEVLKKLLYKLKDT